MRCWNCYRNIPDQAKVCGFCEAEATTEAPSPEEMEAAEKMLKEMPPETLMELERVFRDSASAEDFVNRIFVDTCPKCGSSKTGDCENDPDIGELLVGRCYDCGHLWCTECGVQLKPGETNCPCWDEDPQE